MRGILLDRDGVINRERSDYVKHWDEFEFLPGALEALRRLTTLDWPILVITNQSAIGRGLVTEGAVADIHQRMITAVAAAGGRIDDVFVCPHRPDAGCACRKPRPGLLHRAAREFQLDLARCYLVGDAPTDLEAARSAGCQPIMVLTGLQAPALASLSLDGVPVVPDLSATVKFIFSNC